MAEKAKKFKLTNLALDEVSFVDSPANKLAKVILFKRDTSGEVHKATTGIKFNLGFKQGGGSEVQSVVFDTKEWNKATAVKWLKDHKMASGKVDETTNTLRFRQADPADFTRFRMVTPGAQLAKALYSTEDSYNTILQTVDMAVRQKFQNATYGPGGCPDYIYMRDLINDSAFFEQQGECYRVDYAINRNADGESEVTLGDKVPVELVYQDVGANTDSTSKSTIPAELLFELGKIKAKASWLDRRLSKLNERSSMYRVPGK